MIDDKNSKVIHQKGNNSWLGMSVDFKYIKPVFEELNSTATTPLLNRGKMRMAKEVHLIGP